MELMGLENCGKSSPDTEAFKLAPCAMAAQDANAKVSSQCCQQVKKLGQNRSCLCAIMLSNTDKSSGIKLEIAMTIPKRCNIADRPVGYKCGVGNELAVKSVRKRNRFLEDRKDTLDMLVQLRDGSPAMSIETKQTPMSFSSLKPPTGVEKLLNLFKRKKPYHHDSVLFVIQRLSIG
ncbi:hypothetical protein ACOSP7_004596 [Xanthoceras sorbifolium]